MGDRAAGRSPGACLPGPALLLVRPEALRLGEDPQAIVGTVTARRFTGPSSYFTVLTASGATIEVVAPPAAVRAGERVGILPSRRAAGGLHLFPADERVSAPRRARSARRCCWPCSLWLVLYPLVLVLAEGVRGPAGWTLDHVREFVGAPHRDAGAVGQSLDLARERGARGAARAFRSRSCSARYDLPGRPRARRTGGAARGAAAAGRRGRVPLSLRRDRLRLAAADAAAPAGGSAVAAGGRRRDPAGPRLLDVRLLLPAGPRRAGLAGRLAARGGRQPRRRPVAHAAPGGPAAPQAGARGRRAPHLHDRARLVQRAVRLRRRLPGDAHPDRRHPAQRREPARHGRDRVARRAGAAGAAPVPERLRAGPGRGGRKGAGPARIVIRRRSARLAAGLVGWALALLLLLPHLTLVLVSFVPVGTWTTEPLPPAYTVRQLSRPGGGPGAGAAAGEQPLARDGGDRRRGGDRARGRAAAARGGRRAPRRAIEGLLALPWAVPGTVFAIALATAFSVHQPLAGRFVLVGTLWILPLAYLVRNLPITSRAHHGGRARARSRRSTRRRPAWVPDAGARSAG